MEDDRPELAAGLLALLSEMSVESRYHLRCALEAAVTPGVGGTMLVEIQRRTGEHTRVKWVGGSTGLNLPI